MFCINVGMRNMAVRPKTTCKGTVIKSNPSGSAAKAGDGAGSFLRGPNLPLLLVSIVALAGLASFLFLIENPFATEAVAGATTTSVATATTTTLASDRTVADVRSIFSKNGGSLGTNGSLEFIFDRKGVFSLPVPEGQDEDDLTLELIDGGAKFVVDTGDILRVVSSVASSVDTWVSVVDAIST